MNSATSVSSPPARLSPVMRAVLLHAGLTLLCALMLDGGVHLNVFCRVSVGFWCRVLMVMIRRSESPTRSDVLYLRHGLWGVLVLSFVVATLLIDFTGGVPYFRP